MNMLILFSGLIVLAVVIFVTASITKAVTLSRERIKNPLVSRRQLSELQSKNDRLTDELKRLQEQIELLQTTNEDLYNNLTYEIIDDVEVMPREEKKVGNGLDPKIIKQIGTEMLEDHKPLEFEKIPKKKLKKYKPRKK